MEQLHVAAGTGRRAGSAAAPRWRAAPPCGPRHASNRSAPCVAARLQVLLLAFLPLLIKEDTRCGRCFERLRTVYNEAFA